MLNAPKREVLNSHYGETSMHSGKVILITGGTGQVGTAAAAALQSERVILSRPNRDYHIANRLNPVGPGAYVGLGNTCDDLRQDDLTDRSQRQSSKPCQSRYCA